MYCTRRWSGLKALRKRKITRKRKEEQTLPPTSLPKAGERSLMHTPSFPRASGGNPASFSAQSHSGLGGGETNTRLLRETKRVILREVTGRKIHNLPPPSPQPLSRKRERGTNLQYERRLKRRLSVTSSLLNGAKLRCFHMTYMLSAKQKNVCASLMAESFLKGVP
jgi:hypothetical protein